MKTTSIFFLFFLIVTNGIFAQTTKPIFIGLEPAITKEKFYEEKEFDINIIPIVIQFPVTKRLDLRFTTLANYHFCGDNKFSDIGLFSVLPIFLKKKEYTSDKSSGFYIGPVSGFGKNLINKHYTTTVALESGFMFPTSNKFSLTLGLQFGGSHFAYENQSNKWMQHFGYKVNIGFWIR